jgi:hypothetical protein
MDRLMGQVKQLDQRMNEAGYPRLMPVDFRRSMSNRLIGSISRKTLLLTCFSAWFMKRMIGSRWTRRLLAFTIGFSAGIGNTERMTH